jgi:hypothetical protein
MAINLLLMSPDFAEFTYVREQTGAATGNLTIRITILKEAGNIEVTKIFRNNYPLMLCSLISLAKKSLLNMLTPREIT